MTATRGCRLHAGLPALASRTAAITNVPGGRRLAVSIASLRVAENAAGNLFIPHDAPASRGRED
jgi:hypothetical protein